MKTSEFVQLQRRMLPELPGGLTVKGRMTFFAPVHRTLRAIHFETSAFSKEAFYVNLFFQPLYVPADHLHFTFGDRIGAGWRIDEPECEAALLKAIQNRIRFLGKLRTEHDISNALKPIAKRGNLHAREAFAYSLIQCGEIAKAAKELRSILAQIDSTSSWQPEIAERVARVLDLLSTDLTAVNSLFAVWETETALKLGLAEFHVVETQRN